MRKNKVYYCTNCGSCDIVGSGGLVNERLSDFLDTRKMCNNCFSNLISYRVFPDNTPSVNNVYVARYIAKWFKHS